MPTAEQIADKVLDAVIGTEVDSDTLIKVLRMMLYLIAVLAANKLASGPAAEARILDIARAVKDLQEELAAVINSTRRSRRVIRS